MFQLSPINCPSTALSVPSSRPRRHSVWRATGRHSRLNTSLLKTRSYGNDYSELQQLELASAGDAGGELPLNGGSPLIGALGSDDDVSQT